jgi:hypothetical protein
METYTLTTACGKTCKICQPSMVVQAKVLPFLLKDDLFEAGKYVVTECWIEGDREILKDENLMAECALSVVSLITVKIADIKKN